MDPMDDSSSESESGLDATEESADDPDGEASTAPAGLCVVAYDDRTVAYGP